MKVLTKIPSKEYPYLAVWVGRDQSLDPKLLHNIKLEDIVLATDAYDNRYFLNEEDADMLRNNK